MVFLETETKMLLCSISMFSTVALTTQPELSTHPKEQYKVVWVSQYTTTGRLSDYGAPPPNCLAQTGLLHPSLHVSTGGGYLCTYKPSVSGETNCHSKYYGVLPSQMLLAARTTHKNNKQPWKQKISNLSLWDGCCYSLPVGNNKCSSQTEHMAQLSS